MRITKKIREEAAMICALTASSSVPFPLYSVSAKWIRASKQALRLAYEAAFDAALRTHTGICCEVDAEAEAMLRTGWRPE